MLPLLLPVLAFSGPSLPPGVCVFVWMRAESQGGSTKAGIMGELAAGRADIAAFPLSIVLPRPD